MREKHELVVLSMADGIGTGHHVLNMLDVKHRYLAVEICPIKRQIADHNAEIERPVDDIYELLKWLKNNKETAKKIGLVLCGFSCKSLSSAGKRELFDGSSKIFFECVKVLNYIKSINPNVKFLFENVSSMPLVCEVRISEELKVDDFQLDAGLVSPQGRIRKYWFNWPHKRKEIVDRQLWAKDYLDDDGLEVISFSKSNRGKDDLGNSIVQGRLRTDKKAGTLMTGTGCKGQSTMNQVITKKMKVRDPTVQECLRWQGIDFLDFSIVTKDKAYEAIGDGWQFNAVKLILGWGYEATTF